MSNKINIFSHISSLTFLKEKFDSGNSDVIKSYNPFMINRILSMWSKFIPIINLINYYPNLPKKTHYNFFLSALPKKKIRSKYLKRIVDKQEGQTIKRISEYFEVSLKDAERYSYQLSDKIKKEIVDKYKSGVLN